MSKLGFITGLVFESLVAPMRGRHSKPQIAGASEIGVTWIGHSSFLVQLEGAIDSA